MNNEEILRAQENRRKAAELLTLSGNIQRELNTALTKIESARNWGIWDIFGGGFITNMIKHSRLDDAMGHINTAKPMLDRLGRELGEIKLQTDMHTQVGGFAIFADFFFDGLFADMYMQSKIRQFKDDVSRTLSELQRVDRALQQLDQYEAQIIREAKMP